MTPLSDVADALQSPVAVREAELERLRWLRNDSDEARSFVSVLADHFGHETNLGLKRLTGRLIIRFAERRCDVPGLVEDLAAALSTARSRDQTNSAAIMLHTAAEKGWDLAPAMQAVIDLCLAGWRTRALDILTVEAGKDVDVLSFSSTGGMELWEVVRLMFEAKGNAGDRWDILKLLAASARHRLDRLPMYRFDVELALKDERMPAEFRTLAATCLAAIEAAEARTG